MFFFILILKTYFWLTMCYLLLCAILSLGSISNLKAIAKHHFHIKWILYIWSMIGASFLLIPYFLIRPRHLTNAWLMHNVVIPFQKCLGVKVQVQNAHILAENPGAIVCLNHQSFLDNLVLGEMINSVPKAILISKIEMKNYWPMLWLRGNYFLDRKSPKQAYATLGEIVDVMKREKKTNVYFFPEGTRNTKMGLLPFRRGAFKTAIKAQLPIIPVAISHYSFMDHEKKIFKKGRIICKVLEPISTIGMEESDHEALMAKTWRVMSEEHEILNTYLK